MNFLNYLKTFLGLSEPEVISPLAKEQPQQPPAPQMPVRDDFETYKQKVFGIYKNQLGPAVRESTDLGDYFPLLQEDLMKYMYDTTADKRAGTEYLLPIQALFESTGGRATGGSRNLFGTLPTGEGGKPSSFGSFKESIDYQLSPNVLGGGVGNKLNILEGEGPISPDDITRVYDSYNPNSPYLDSLLQMYKPLMERK